MTKVDVIANTQTVLERIAKATQQAERADGEVSLIIVSKTFPADRVLPLLKGGYRTFGENRVQEAQGKWPALKSDYPDTRLHLIGGLQTNKAADAVALFDVIETLDREKLARALGRAMIAEGRRPDLFVQVNTGEEAQKGGIAPGEAVAFARWCRVELDLPVVGMMSIPPFDEVPAPHFALTAKLAEEAGLPQVSMGMSGDYDVAAQMGATHVRVGSAIFGPRK
ncbi:MAG: YggS family pyridoxal phosphate-dependent enzyme [Pseudomonadota bacterium]